MLNGREDQSTNPYDAERARPVRPLDWARMEGVEDIVEKAMRAGVRRRKQVQIMRSSVIVAVILVVGGTFWLRTTDTEKPLHPEKLHFVTTPTTRALADGSTVELNSSAEIRVDFSESVRRVFLDQGEAHFVVAKNAQKPFLVVAGGVEVKAVGTAFSVQLSGETIDVVVTEGRVTVAQSADAQTPILLDAGQAAVVRSIDSTQGVESVTELDPAELSRRLAWRIPMLELNFTPLGEVVAVVSQHAGVPIRLADPSLAKLKLTGRLRANNLSVLLQILESSYGLRCEKYPSGEIVLQSPR